MASTTWRPANGVATTIEALRATLTVLAENKTGQALIDDKFTKDHIYAGHQGPIEKLAPALARLREKSPSTIIISSMNEWAQEEVLNWIENVPASKLTYFGGVWTISTKDSTVKAVHQYKFATVDLKIWRHMKLKCPDDLIKKSREWLKESFKTPSVACQFDIDGTPKIYHLDF